MTKRSDYTASGKALVQQQAAADGPTDDMKAHWAFMKAREDKLAKWVTHGLKPEALLRWLMLDLQNSDKLRACTRESLYLALLACAVTGLEPGALKGEAYLVPFGGKAQFMIGWKGIVKQARRSREVVGMTANVVRDRDVFDLDLGTKNQLIHKPANGERGDVIGSYSIANMGSGHHEIEWVDRDDLDKIRAVAESRGKSPAWRDWPDQMARKTAMRRLGKRLPMGGDYFAGLAIERAAEDGQSQQAVLNVITEGAASSGLPPAPPVEMDVVGAPISEEEMAAIIAKENQEHTNG